MQEDGRVIGEVVTHKGLHVLLRYPKLEDVPQFLDFINTLSRERTYLHVQGRQFTLEQETAYLEGALEAIRNKWRVQVSAFVNGELVGNTEITRDGFDSNAHRAGLGIAVAAPYRGQGVGEVLMRTVLREAANLDGIQLVLLTVFGNNTAGIKLYEKVGFVEYGRLPGGVKHRDEYVDEVSMVWRRGEVR